MSRLMTVVELVTLARHGGRVFRATRLMTFLLLVVLLQVSLGGFVASSAVILWSIFTL